MLSLIAPKRVEITGGTWTPKVGGKFDQGNAEAHFFVEGHVEIKELGGHLKLFCRDMKLEKKKVLLTDHEMDEIKREYRENVEKEHAAMLERGDDVPTAEEALAKEEVDLKKLNATALEEKEESIVLPNKLFMYLTRIKPKTKMNDVARNGTKVHCPATDGTGRCNGIGSSGTFEASLKDIPDALQYMGVIVVKMPQDPPVTEGCIVYGLVKLQSAKHAKIHSISSIKLGDLSNVLKKVVEQAERQRPPTKPSEAVKPSSYYSGKAKAAWVGFNLEPSEEVDFKTFCKMLDKVDIFLCEAQAHRIYVALDVDGSGEISMSEFENFLMAFDIMGQAGNDLVALDVFDSLKMVPSDDFGEFSHHEGLDLSGFMEAVEMLGIKDGTEPEEVLRAFTNNKKGIDPNKIFLGLQDFKKAWLKVADLQHEFKSRNLKYDPSPMAAGRARERMLRIITDQEDAYLANLKKINDVVEKIKKERRAKKDEKKREKAEIRDGLLHAAAKFQAVRSQEKRLMAKIAEEEKTKKRFEERALRAKLMAQQKDAKDREMREINEKRMEGEKLRSDEVRAHGLDRMSLSLKGFRKIPQEYYHELAAQTKLSYLQYFDLSHNILDELPEVNFFYFLTELRQLKLTNNRLKHLPTNEIQYLAKLEILELENNRLESLPELIDHLTSLQRIDISNNKLHKLPEGLGLCTNLRHFVAHSNELKLLPNTLGGCFAMEYIDVSRNMITELPEDMSHMTNLRHLDASTNRIGHLPREIGSCSKLLYLDLSTNILVFLPASFAKLAMLEVCRLERNELIMQPDRLTGCKSLKELNIKRNATHAITSDIGTCHSLQRLDASSNQIREVPAEIGLITTLQVLDLSDNDLVSIPPEIASCGMIQDLNVRSNRIKGCLPETIGLVESLLQIDISNNRVDELPRSVIGLKRLVSLQAESCLLYKLPDTLIELRTLRVLNLCNNRFTRFPIELSQMANLEELDLRSNSLELLPRTIKDMHRLQSLNLSKNLLRALPVEFVEVLESVPTVDLTQNPWTDLPDKWGKKWQGKHATSDPTGYSVADAVDFLYGMRTFYDCAEEIWKEHGVFHFTHRLGLGDFLEELRQRIPNTWHEGLSERAKFIYFRSRSTGIFPRWYSLENYEHVQDEIVQMKEIDSKRREENVRRAKEAAVAKEERMRKAYDVGPRIRAQQAAIISEEHMLNEQVISNMATTAMQHCLWEREAIAIKRADRREGKYLNKERIEMERLNEILDADRNIDSAKRKRKNKRRKAEKIF